MTERKPMSNEQRLREALEEIKFLHDHHVIHLDGCSFANDMGHIALNVLASTEPEQPDPNDCRDCGAGHWYNFMVPDDVWKKIAPDQPCLPEEGGILCAQCIDKRCAALGIEAEGKFYFTGKAVVSRYPEERGEQIEGWAVNTWMALWEFAANDENFTPGPASKPATLIIHADPPEPAGRDNG